VVPFSLAVIVAGLVLGGFGDRIGFLVTVSKL
jgi:hypothetical protein